MGQSVEQRPGQALGTERLGPLVEGKIRGDQNRGALVALTAACTSSVPNVSNRRRTCTYSRRPARPERASISRRSVANASGSSHPASGAARSSAPTLRSMRGS